VKPSIWPDAIASDARYLQNASFHVRTAEYTSPGNFVPRGRHPVCGAYAVQR
jgi:hypothetical protein